MVSFTCLTKRIERSYFNAWWKSWKSSHWRPLTHQEILFHTTPNSNELYKIQFKIKYKKPTQLQTYFEKIFINSNLDWKTIFLLPRIATVDTIIRVFQYKILNDTLFQNKMLYRFGMSQDSLCFFCSLEEEIPMHTFYSCNLTQILWERLKYYIPNNLDPSSLTWESAILGITHSQPEKLLSIFKNYILSLDEISILVPYN